MSDMGQQRRISQVRGMSAKRLIPEKFSLLFRSILEISRQIRTLGIWRAMRDKDENWRLLFNAAPQAAGTPSTTKRPPANIRYIAHGGLKSGIPPLPEGAHEPPAGAYQGHVSGHLEGAASAAS
jgi:hypothetical protein